HCRHIYSNPSLTAGTRKQIETPLPRLGDSSVNHRLAGEAYRCLGCRRLDYFRQISEHKRHRETATFCRRYWNHCDCLRRRQIERRMDDDGSGQISSEERDLDVLSSLPAQRKETFRVQIVSHLETVETAFLIAET